MRTCRVCSVELTDENCPQYRLSTRNYICNTCKNEKERQYYRKNPSRVMEIKKRYQKKNRDKILAYNRQHYIVTNGKFISGLNKRPYPSNKQCELCGKHVVRLAYHHWDDDNLNLGLWLCRACHFLAERTEKGITSEKYLRFKEEIEAKGLRSKWA